MKKWKNIILWQLNHIETMNSLGYHYQYNVKDRKKMKKYYLIAIKLNDPEAINHLGDYYYNNLINVINYYIKYRIYLNKCNKDRMFKIIDNGKCKYDDPDKNERIDYIKNDKLIMYNTKCWI